MKNQRKGTQPTKKFKLLDDQLTNNELIKQLKKFPGNAPIWTEGCDCYGIAFGVRTMDHEKDGIIITRNN